MPRHEAFRCTERKICETATDDEIIDTAGTSEKEARNRSRTLALSSFESQSTSGSGSGSGKTDSDNDGARYYPVDQKPVIPLLRPYECARVFYTKESFYAHLEEPHRGGGSGGHGIGDKRTRKEIKKRGRVGRSGHKGFWCGFCQMVIVQGKEKRGLEAWDERFTHVDEMHFQKVCHPFLLLPKLFIIAFLRIPGEVCKDVSATLPYIGEEWESDIGLGTRELRCPEKLGIPNQSDRENSFISFPYRRRSFSS